MRSFNGQKRRPWAIGVAVTSGAIATAFAMTRVFDAFNLDETKIDVAVPPVWFLTSDEGTAIVRQHIKPKHIVAVHMPAEGPLGAIAQMRGRFPDAVPFTVLLEKQFY